MGNFACIISYIYYPVWIYLPFYQDKLIDDIFSSPYQFNSIKRIGSALRGGLRGRNPSYTYDKTKRVIEELSMNINNASNIIDADDVTVSLISEILHEQLLFSIILRDLHSLGGGGKISEVLSLTGLAVYMLW